MGHPRHLQRLYHKVALDTYGPFPVTCRCGGLIHKFSSEDGCVHHKDEDPYNNTPENLEIIHHACHTSHHKTGFHHTEETKTRISDTMKDREFTDEHRANLSKALVGRQFTDEWRTNISKSAKGRVLSAETRAKMSAAHRPRLEGKCSCGMVNVRGAVARHAKAAGHTWERL